MKILNLKTGLLGKLIAVNLLAVLCAVGITWWALDGLAADYFMTLMKKFNISSETTNSMFLEAVHRYLLWAGAAALLLAAGLSFMMMKRLLGPLLSMNRLTRSMARGDFKQRVPQVTADEVGELAHSFNEMAASLERLEALRHNMVIDVAHELRTPITNILGYLEGIQDGVCEASEETVELLHEEAQRLKQAGQRPDGPGPGGCGPVRVALCGSWTWGSCLRMSYRPSSPASTRSGWSWRWTLTGPRPWPRPIRIKCAGCLPTCWKTRSTTPPPGGGCS